MAQIPVPILPNIVQDPDFSGFSIFLLAFLPLFIFGTTFAI
ncbi:hypothetical protein DSOL_4845 [Desulfosporosinus metallidurans]|uniref:Uncharacterized protein n=1 Tax=Desulfosporosinus metallidurans TaxID=1888891 RepID=A0A1Q8QHF2_9FIRM|nr:hypothetical protein DSOL_4845 [Desulfosporosinus metallidurans]